MTIPAYYSLLTRGTMPGFIKSTGYIADMSQRWMWIIKDFSAGITVILIMIVIYRLLPDETHKNSSKEADNNYNEREI